MSTAIANQLFLAYLGRPADSAWQSSTASLLNGSAPSAALQGALCVVSTELGRNQ